jgi:hypothetical protein
MRLNETIYFINSNSIVFKLQSTVHLEHYFDIATKHMILIIVSEKTVLFSILKNINFY